MKKHQILLTTSLLILTSFNLSIVSCSSDSNSKENDDIENENNNQEETTKKEETLLATFSKESCINLVNSPKTTDGIYLINDDVTDIINDITLKYSTNVGLTGNSNYPNCIQVKKQTNNNFIISTYKKITKIIITSLKDTSSTRYSIANPDAPLGSQTHTYTYHWTSHKSYNYDLGNWSEDDCKQGSWGHGEVSGHMFFDLTTLRKQMAGTVINSNTITLTRSNTGGIS